MPSNLLPDSNYLFITEAGIYLGTVSFGTHAYYNSGAPTWRANTVVDGDVMLVNAIKLDHEPKHCHSNIEDMPHQKIGIMIIGSFIIAYPWIYKLSTIPDTSWAYESIPAYGDQ